ncbi:MAG: carboxypeptidase regulatory-like domain-containing protein [Sphingobacteriales bacterium]|nr:carboxypeptidase regulatory-like domain-containing protein [Sphingobacteriales bacterium]
MKKLFFLFIMAILAFTPAEKTNIKGSISLSGSPIKDVDVVLRKVPGNEIVTTVKTDEKGQYVISDFPAGKYELVIKDLAVTAEKNKAEGKISVGGEWLKKSDVHFYNAENVQIAATLTDSRGNFQFEGLPAGHVSVVIQLGDINE